MQKTIEFTDAALPELDTATIALALAGSGDLHSFQPLPHMRLGHCLFTVGVAGDDVAVVLVDPPFNRGVSVTNHVEFIATELAVQHLPRFAPAAIRWYQIDKDVFGNTLLQRVVMTPPTPDAPRFTTPLWQNLRGWRDAFPGAEEQAA